MTHTTDVTNAARVYLDRGWNVFPLSMDKMPLDDWKIYQTQFITTDDIDRWEDEGAPTKSGVHARIFNLALVTGKLSGIIVVDCDNEEAIAAAKRLGLTSAFAVKTSRGSHFYFRHPGGGKEFRNKAGSNPGSSWHAVPGLDLRGDGGYVVCPPSTSLNDDGTIRHTYEFQVAEGLDWDDMPTYPGIPDSVDPSQGFSFDTLDLTATRVITDQGSFDVVDQIKVKCAHLGRKLQGPNLGDGTDQWMIRFCGQQVRRGIVGVELQKSVQDFFNEFFDYRLSAPQIERWLTTKMRSAMDMDRRNHPSDYTAMGDRIGAKDAVNKSTFAAPAFLPVYAKDIDRILGTMDDAEFHADPLLPLQSIVQVVGYNGHGKSFFLTSLLISLASGNKEYGPYAFGDKIPKILYLDFDNPPRTILSRAKSFVAQFGDTKDNLGFVSPALQRPEDGGEMNLTTEEGQNTLNRWLVQERPQIVVIDTIRNAFGGFDENLASEWHKVNYLAKQIRDQYKATVVLVHHRNKPGEGGMHGREAGSTAQMTNIDTQIFVTQVYRDEEVSKKKAGIFNGKRKIDYIRSAGGADCPFEFLEERAKARGFKNSRIRMCSEISFGKVRQMGELHDTHYIGFMEDLATGLPHLESTPSKRQQAVYLNEYERLTHTEVSKKLMVPRLEIDRWLAPKKIILP